MSLLISRGAAVTTIDHLHQSALPEQSGSSCPNNDLIPANRSIAPQADMTSHHKRVSVDSGGIDLAKILFIGSKKSIGITIFHCFQDFTTKVWAPCTQMACL